MSERAGGRDGELLRRLGRQRQGHLRQAAAHDRQQREEARRRAEAAAHSTLGLGHDIEAGLKEPTPAQLDALRRIVVHVFCEQFPSIVAYGAGWTDRRRQQPVGDHGRFEPREVEAILDAELARALKDADPVRGMLQLVARWSAAFLLDRNGVPAHTALGSARVAGKLQRALPDGRDELRDAVWALMRPMLSPHLAQVNHDEFVAPDDLAPTIDLAAHRADSDLADINLGQAVQAA